MTATNGSCRLRTPQMIRTTRALAVVATQYSQFVVNKGRSTLASENKGTCATIVGFCRQQSTHRQLRKVNTLRMHRLFTKAGNEELHISFFASCTIRQQKSTAQISLKSSVFARDLDCNGSLLIKNSRTCTCRWNRRAQREDKFADP